MSGDPGVEFSEGLLKVVVEVGIEDVTVLAKDFSAEKVKSADGTLGLLVISLKFIF
jgi:hypothetical protein